MSLKAIATKIQPPLTPSPELQLLNISVGKGQLGSTHPSSLIPNSEFNRWRSRASLSERLRQRSR